MLPIKEQLLSQNTKDNVKASKTPTRERLWREFKSRERLERLYTYESNKYQYIKGERNTIEYVVLVYKNV